MEDVIYQALIVARGEEDAVIGRLAWRADGSQGDGAVEVVTLGAYVEYRYPGVAKGFGG